MPNVIPEDARRKLENTPARTPLGKQLRASREEYIRSGGKLLSMEEIDRELADRRGERYPVE